MPKSCDCNDGCTQFCTCNPCKEQLERHCPCCCEDYECTCCGETTYEHEGE